MMDEIRTFRGPEGYFWTAGCGRRAMDMTPKSKIVKIGLDILATDGI